MDENEYQMKNDDLREQAWEFFKLQASQRLTTFNFYIILASLLTTGIAATFKDEYRFPYVGIALGLLLMLFSFIFWKLDERNKELIKGAESTLKYFEGKSPLWSKEKEPHIALKFTREEYETNRQKDKRSWQIWKNGYSYSECFKFVFAVFCLIGVAGILVTLGSMIFGEFIGDSTNMQMGN